MLLKRLLDTVLAACFFLVLSKVPLPAMGSTSWQPCSEGAMQVSSVDISPENPRHGDQMRVSIKGTNSKVVEDGDLKVAVSYHGFHVYSSHGPLCNAASCPLQVGPVTIENDWKLPSLAPPGPYSIKLTGVDNEGATFMCVDINFSVGGGSGNSDNAEAPKEEAVA